MISLKSLMAAEEGRATAASPTSAKADDLGSWLSDYNKSKGGITGAVQGASSSVTSLLSSFTASSSSASSASSSSPSSVSTTNPDLAPASSYSSWFSFAPSASASETASLTTPSSSSSSTSTSSSSSSITSSSWLPSISIPGYGTVGEDNSVCFGLSYQQRLGLFFMCCVAGVIMLFLSFTFLSLLLLGSAAKFTLSYATANVCFLMASSFLTGPKAQLTSMFHSSRVVVSVCYLLSLFGLLFAAWQVRVFYVVIPLCIVQVVCLLCYVMSYLPFGLPVMKRLFGVFWSSITKMIGV